MNNEKKATRNLTLGMVILALSGLLLGGVAGYYGSHVYLETYVLNQMKDEGYVDTTLATATADDIVEGKTAFIDGEIVSGNVVLFDTSDATATSDVILKGKTAYVNGKLVVGTISVVPEDTITPQQDPTTINGGVYLSGNITVKGDADFTRGNIRHGVLIFNVTGTYNPALEQSESAGGE